MMLSVLYVSAQKQEERKGMFYFSAGTHRAFYTPSTVRLVSDVAPSFDFTLEKLRAKDDQGFKITASPQYTYNAGYYSFQKNAGIEFQFDHVKYKIREGQVSRLRGEINKKIFDLDTVVHADFVQLEHTDGANYAMINLVKWKQLTIDKKNAHSLNLFLKAGGGLVIPKTNSTIMGKHNDDRYAVSGYVIGVEPGLRYNFLKNFFASASVKGAYANYQKFRIADGFGSQQWFSVQFNLMIGVQVAH